MPVSCHFRDCKALLVGSRCKQRYRKYGTFKAKWFGMLLKRRYLSCSDFCRRRTWQWENTWRNEATSSTANADAPIQSKTRRVPSFTRNRLKARLHQHLSKGSLVRYDIYVYLYVQMWKILSVFVNTDYTVQLNTLTAPAAAGIFIGTMPNRAFSYIRGEAAKIPPFSWLGRQATLS